MRVLLMTPSLASSGEVWKSERRAHQIRRIVDKVYFIHHMYVCMHVCMYVY